MRTSWSALVLKLLPTFRFRCQTLRSGGGKHGSYWGTTPMRCSSCLWVVVPCSIPTRSSVWLGLTSTGCNPYWRSSGDCCKGDWLAKKLCGLFWATGFSRFINEKQPGECLWGQVVPSAPFLRSQAAQESTPGCEAAVIEAEATWEGDLELACPQVANVERSLPDASALADWNILHPLQVSF
jgi:hypothetical protein